MAVLKDAAKAQDLLAQLNEKDPVSATGVRFLRNVEEFRSAETFDLAVEIYHTFLGEESVELLAVSPDIRAVLVSRVKQDDYSDRALFDEACRAAVAALEAAPLVRQILLPSGSAQPQVRQSPPPLPRSSPPPARPTQPASTVASAAPAASSSGNSNNSVSPAPPSHSALPPQLVLRDELDLGEEDFLGGSDDELLNRNESLDDIVLN